MNILTITCESPEIMRKIKKLIFTYDSSDNTTFTMSKLLPMPNGLSENPSYSEIGYYWCIAMWGTKWDACYPRVFESGSTIVIDYDTAWDPNFRWVKALCNFIEVASYSIDKSTERGIKVKHFFCEKYEDYGTECNWDPLSDWTFKENVPFSDELLPFNITSG